MIQAIDVHGHVGRYYVGISAFRDQWFSGSAQDVVRRARRARVGLTVVSSLEALMPWGGDVSQGNEQARQAAEAHPELLFWAVLDPRLPRSFEEVQALLGHPRCAGIKIHPAQHSYDIRDRGEAVFEFAAAQRALVQTHCGEPGCFPEQFVPLLDRWPAATLILSHLGCDSDGSPSLRHVAAVSRCRAGNVCLDTSSALRGLSRLSWWRRFATCEITQDAILCHLKPGLYPRAGDSPRGDSPSADNVGAQRARIEHAEISRQAKQAILTGNAQRLLGAKCGAIAAGAPVAAGGQKVAGEHPK